MDAESITFKTHINPMHAENAIKQLGNEMEPSQRFRIDFSKCVFIDPSAGWRLGNSLRRHAEKELIELILPDRHTTPSEQWFKTFTRTGLGYAAAFHCNQIISEKGTSIAEDIKSYYQSIENVPARTHVLVSGIRRNRPFNVDDFSQFNSTFLRMLSRICVQPPSQHLLQSLSTLVFEAVQNVYDHSGSAPLPRSTQTFDYACINYYANIRNPPDVEKRFAAFLKRIAASPNQDRRQGFMEVVVNDDGVGIAARQSQESDIYWRTDRSDEKLALITALSRGGSIKFVTKDCPIRYDPGLGTYKIIDALRKLSAFAFIRTGRLLAYFNGSDESQLAFDVSTEELGYMPGTAMEVVVPLVTSQLMLDF